MAQDGVIVLAYGQVFDREAAIGSLNQAHPRPSTRRRRPTTHLSQ